MTLGELESLEYWVSAAQGDYATKADRANYEERVTPEVVGALIEQAKAYHWARKEAQYWQCRVHLVALQENQAAMATRIRAVLAFGQDREATGSAYLALSDKIREKEAQVRQLEAELEEHGVTIVKNV